MPSFKGVVPNLEPPHANVQVVQIISVQRMHSMQRVEVSLCRGSGLAISCQ